MPIAKLACLQSGLVATNLTDHSPMGSNGMNKNVLCGILAALLGLTGLIFLLASDSHFAISQWPYEAFQGLVFSFVWGFGVSTIVAQVYSGLVVITVAVVAFAIGHKLSRFLASTDTQTQ